MSSRIETPGTPLDDRSLDDRTTRESQAASARASTSRRRKASWAWLAGPALLAVAALTWFTWMRPSEPNVAVETPPPMGDSVPLDADARAKAGIAVQTPIWIERTDRIDTAGIVALDERHTARLGAIVEGVVEHLMVQAGDRVKAGTLLATIHSHIVHDAWAAYFKALAERRRYENELRYASVAEARATRLLADKALSPQEVDRARSDRIAAEQGLTSAKAEETRASQELAHYGITAREAGNPREEDTVPVSAPFAGVVIERQVSDGTAVTIGTPLFVLSDLSSLWVTAEIDEALIGAVALGLPVEVQVTAYPGEVFRGRITAIGDVVNPATRRVTVRCELANADGRLKPNMFARVLLNALKPRRVLVIPARAIQEMEGQTVVFARTTGDRFQRRPIVTGATVNGLTEVVSGADEDDDIAVSGAFLIKSELMKPQSADR